MTFNFNLGIKEKKKSAKERLYLVGVTALRACGTPESISFLGFTFNIANKLRQEINRLSEQQAQKALTEIEKEIGN